MDFPVRTEDCTSMSLKTHYPILPKVISFIIPSSPQASDIIYMQMELKLKRPL